MPETGFSPQQQIPAFDTSGLTPIRAGGGQDSGADSLGQSQGDIIGWARYLGDGNSQRYSTTGQEQGVYHNPGGFQGFLDSGGKGILMIAAEALSGGYLSGAFSGGAAAVAGAAGGADVGGLATLDSAAVTAEGAEPGLFSAGSSAGSSAIEAANTAQNAFRASEIAAQTGGQGALDAMGLPVMPDGVTGLNPTDMRLANGTQLPPGSSPELPVELNPTDQRLADGTQTTPGGSPGPLPTVPNPSATPSPSSNPFVNPNGSYNWANILAAAGTAISIGGKVGATPQTIRPLGDLGAVPWTGLPSGGGGSPGGAGGVSGGFGAGFTPAQMTAFSTPFRAGDQLSRIYSADMRSPIVSGVVTTNKTKHATGGLIQGPLTQAFASGGEPYPFVGFVQGDGGGQSDLIDANLSPGEYVFDAESVSMLGDGNNAEGAKKLDELRQQLRAQKRSAPDDEIAPPAQGPLSYIGGQNA